MKTYIVKKDFLGFFPARTLFVPLLKQLLKFLKFKLWTIDIEKCRGFN